MTMTKTKFVVDMTKAETDRTARFYKERIIENARKWNLTLAGEDFPPVRSGIQQAGMGNLLTVGTAPNHDMEWIRRPEFACEKGYKPVYDIVEDYNTIVQELFKYAQEKNKIRLISGTKVSFHDGFVKIGEEIVTNDELENLVSRTKRTTNSKIYTYIL